MKRHLSALLAALLVLILSFTACGKKEEEPAVAEPAPQEQETAEEPAPGEEANDTAILVVSFGTSYNDSRDITIGAVEEAIAKAHPEYDVRRAFTAQIIIDKLADRDSLDIDNVTEALDRAVADGVKNLVVQPTHLMDGFEYNDLMAELDSYKSDFDSISVGRPLLTSNEDYEAVIGAITGATAEYDDGETAIVFMGHGTEAVSNEVYGIMQNKITADGYENYYIGTVEATPSLDDVLEAVKAKGSYRKVVLEPLMVVAGDHANNDMAGDEEDSWKTAFENAGFEVECVLKGLGEMEDIQKIYVDHVDKAIAKLHQSEDTAILAVSFGTSFNNSRDITIGAVENELADAFPEYPVYRAFTAQIIIDKLADEYDIDIDNVQEAMDKLVADGKVKNLIVQPTHLMNGFEYNDLVEEVSGYESDFDKIVIGDPLLTSDEDFEKVADAIVDSTADCDDGETAIVFMGHGTEAESNGVYAKMQETLTAKNMENYFVGTVEATPSLDDVLEAVKAKGSYKKVVLEPLMVVAGDHANNDMAGDEEDSWKTAFEKAGFEVTCRLTGLGEMQKIRDIYVEHVQAAVDSL